MCPRMLEIASQRVSKFYIFLGGMHLDPFEWHVAKQRAMLAMQT